MRVQESVWTLDLLPSGPVKITIELMGKGLMLREDLGSKATGMDSLRRAVERERIL